MIKFNEGEDKEVGPDDIEQVLEYIFIKAHPFKMFTNLEFIKIFSDNLGKHESCIAIFESICKLILDFKIENNNLNLIKDEKK